MLRDWKDSRESLADRILARANEIYGCDHLSWPDLIPQKIDDDGQAMAVLKACAEEIESLREEMERYYERKHDDGYHS